MKLFALFAVAVLCAGCVQTKSLNELSYSESVELIDELVQLCRDQGVKDNTDKMRACVYHELDRENAERETAKVNNYNRRMAIGMAMSGMSQGFYNASSTYRPPTTCTYTPHSTNIGGSVSSVTSTCY